MILLLLMTLTIYIETATSTVCADYAGINCASAVNLGHCSSVALVRDIYCRSTCGTCLDQPPGYRLVSASQQPIDGSTTTQQFVGLFQNADDCAMGCAEYDDWCKGFIYSNTGADTSRYQKCWAVIVSNPPLKNDPNWSYFVLNTDNIPYYQLISTSQQPTDGSTATQQSVGVVPSSDDCAKECNDKYGSNCKGFIYSNTGPGTSRYQKCWAVVVSNPPLKTDPNWSYFVLGTATSSDSHVFEIYQMVEINVLISALVTTIAICSLICILKCCCSKKKGYSKVVQVNEDENDDETP